MRPHDLKPHERVILALDVPTPDAALRLVDELEGVISFYKVGLELLMAGGLGDLLNRLKDKQVFVDLKLPDDITETIKRVVRLASEKGVRFLTLSHSVRPSTIQAAIEGRRGATPELLWVPFVSSLDEHDFAKLSGRDPSEFHAELRRRAEEANGLGVDGFIVSGQEIAVLRAAFPAVPLVSPGIRPSWAPQDDHKRVCTPAEAIRLGADYIVVGRPIRNAPDRKAAAQRVIDEVAGEVPSCRDA